MSIGGAFGDTGPLASPRCCAGRPALSYSKERGRNRVEAAILTRAQARGTGAVTSHGPLKAQAPRDFWAPPTITQCRPFIRCEDCRGGGGGGGRRLSQHHSADTKQFRTFAPGAESRAIRHHRRSTRLVRLARRSATKACAQGVAMRHVTDGAGARVNWMWSLSAAILSQRHRPVLVQLTCSAAIASADSRLCRCHLGRAQRPGVCARRPSAGVSPTQAGFHLARVN